MTIGQRIKELRNKKNMSQVAFADEINVSKQTLYKYENDIITNIPSDKIEAIAELCHVSPAYLMGWSEDHTSLADNIIPMPITKKIPLLGNIACGEPILAVENIEDYVDMDAATHADFALRCSGDSMINARIFDGDIVYIRKQETVENGEIAAVLINGIESEANATLKRVYLEGNKIRLCAENPMYSDQIFFENEMNKVKIIGKAVAFLSAVR
ncbi:MAG: helix-turn-helix domain-containing protein [Lachnospiraceae bacterium]|nr:helix-turn-helix domain-containing protein [Lachnospiraceae bacterium]